METERDLKRLSKEELIIKYSNIKGNLAKSVNANRGRQAIINNMGLRLIKIKNSIDYLLQHPYSTDSGYSGKAHERDGNTIPRLSQLYHSRKRYKEGKK